MHHRQMEGLGHVDEAHQFFGGARSPATTVVIGVARHHRDRPAVEPGKAGDDRAAPHFADLEERIPVHQRMDDRAHLVDLLRVARHDGEEFFLSAIGVVGWSDTRWQFVDR